MWLPITQRVLLQAASARKLRLPLTANNANVAIATTVIIAFLDTRMM
jgi:hypothetical protein